MTTCTIKRGIFSLRECGNQAVESCAVCGTSICQEHASYAATQVRCPQCASGQEASNNRPDEDVAEWERPGWAQSWRAGFYRNSSYHPFVGGERMVDEFDASDRAGFKRPDGRLLEEDEDEAAGFSDS